MPTQHLTDWVAYNAVRFPGEIAADNLSSGEAVTWSQLEDRVGRLTGVLGARGIARGDRIGMIVDDDWRVLALQFACIRLGAIFVPFNWRLTGAEIELLCKDAELSLLVHDTVWAEVASGIAAQTGVPLASWRDPGGRVDLDARMEATTPVRSRGFYEGGQIAQMLYTSGTTGLPKGALISLGGMAWHALNVQHEMVIGDPPARYLSILPLFHAAGLNAIANPTLLAGGRVSVMPRFDPERAAELLGRAEHGVTNVNGAPVQYRMIADRAPADADFAHIGAAMVGGGLCPPDLGDWYGERGLDLQAGWGATEMGPSATLMPKASRSSKAHTVGLPVRHLQLRVVDPATNLDVAPGETGEAWVRGPAILAGYWRREVDPDPDSQDGWFKSGDGVSVDEDGFVVLRGRFKDMYKSGAENVFAAEVERVIVDHPAVRDAAVIGVPDVKWGEVGHAIVIAEAGAEVIAADVVAHCARRLAKYKLPVQIHVVDDFPRNVTGKVQKNVLREQLDQASR